MADVWAYLPLNDIDEGLSWLTEVDQRRDDESRWGMRPARQTFHLKHELSTSAYVRADQLLKGNVNGEWLVPVWTEATALAVTSGADELAVDPGEFVAGGKAIIWASCDDYEIADVLAVSSGTITISPDVQTSRARALVMPLRAAILMEGARVSRPMRGYWELSLTFTATDNPDLTLLVEPVEIMLSINVAALSGNDSGAEGYSRLDVAKINAKAALDYLEATGAVHDVLVNLWATGASTLRKDACDAAGYEALRAFIDAATSAGASSDYAQAMTGAASFFNGSGRRLQFIITSTAGTNAPAAATIRDGIAGLEVFGVMMGDATTAALKTVDNQDAPQRVDDDGLGPLAVIELALLDLPMFGGLPFLECGGAVLSPQSGQIIRATAYIDSGLGPIIPVEARTVTESTRSTVIRKTDRAGLWGLKRLLHFVRGRDRPLLVADYSIPTIGMTATTAVIADQLLEEPEDWIGRIVNVGGKLREIEAAELATGGVELTFANAAPLPANRALRVVRRVRLYSDDLALQHHRRAAWATLSLDMGEI